MNIPAPLMLIVLPLALSPLVYLIGHLGKRLKRDSLAQLAGIAALIVTCWPLLMAARAIREAGPVVMPIQSIELVFDGLSLLLAVIALILGMVVAVYSGPYLAGEANQEKYYAMLVALIGLMIGLGSAGDLFNLWVWFEAMAVSSYLLVVFYQRSPRALEAGIKYLVQSAIGSALVLLGTGLVLAETGTLALSEIRANAELSPTLMAAGALFVIGFGVKAALVPLHTWLPDAHSQAPSGISAMLSGVVIEAGLIAMLRALSGLAGLSASWGVLLMIAGAFNMLAGNLLALRQTQIKRLLAYSSLSHVGYMLLGLGIALYAGQAAGAQGGLFHLFNHGLMKGLAFMAAGALLYALHIAAGDHEPLTVKDLAGAAGRYPLVALSLAIAVLSLGGLPPFAGFMSKWQVFVAGFETGQVWIEALVIFAALNSVLSLAYYAPLINAIYKREASASVSAGAAIPLTMQAPLALMALAIVLIGLWPGLMTWLTDPAGAALLSGFGG